MFEKNSDNNIVFNQELSNSLADKGPDDAKPAVAVVSLKYRQLSLQDRTKQICKNVPEYMKQRKQWVLWKYEKRGDKETKRPYQVSGAPARSNSPKSWESFEVCIQRFAKGGFRGLGFCFAEGDNLTGLDLDHCINGNKIEPWAQEVLDLFPSTYKEYSPSGDGFHIFCLGSPVRTGQKKWKRSDTKTDQGIEVYNHRSRRYFTFTVSARCIAH